MLGSLDSLSNPTQSPRSNICTRMSPCNPDSPHRLRAIGAGRPGWVLLGALAAQAAALQKAALQKATPPRCPCTSVPAAVPAPEVLSGLAPPHSPRKCPARCAALQLATRCSMCAGAPLPHKCCAGIPAGLLLTAKARRSGFLQVSGTSITHSPRPATLLAAHLAVYAHSQLSDPRW